MAGAELLGRALRRQMRPPDLRGAVDLGEVLREILTWANRLVPSHSGSVLIDNPVGVHGEESVDQRDLYFLACFGAGSEGIVGASLPCAQGIAGETYRSGRPYISEDVRKDRKFFSEMDAKTSFETRSIICAPISVEGRVIGVIELLNRIDRDMYDRNDLLLLEIFAGYTGTLIEKALSARTFEDLSKRDNLTELYNDRYFFHALHFEINRAIENKWDVSLIFFDLDHFKSVNDTYGHMAGSRVLKEVAGILRGVYLGADTVLARYGGDEYVIVLPATPLDEAALLAERMRAEIEGFTFLKDSGAHGKPGLSISGVITCSVGVASLRRNLSADVPQERMADDLIRLADRAMYKSKKSGKNRVTASGEFMQ